MFNRTIERREKAREDRARKKQREADALAARVSSPINKFFAVRQKPIRDPAPVVLPLAEKETEQRISIDLSSEEPLEKIPTPPSSQEQASSQEEFQQPGMRGVVRTLSLAPSFFHNQPVPAEPNFPESIQGERWIERVIKQLRKHSDRTLEESNHPFKSLASQWVATGNIEDAGGACETCELCAQEEIRYQFEIYNARTEEMLWVGSRCIEHFVEMGLQYQEADQEAPLSQEKSRTAILGMVKETQRAGQEKDRFMQSLAF